VPATTLVTGPGRWPTFLVIGAYKAGTTTLHHVLRAHPQVFVPPRQEPNYFAFADEPDPTNPAWAKAVHSEADYKALFAAADDARAVGEVSPEYLLNPAAPEAIARRVPAVTLIAVLRNPVDRAFSDWTMYRREGVEPLDFDAALAQQAARRARGEAHGGYLTVGLYADQLDRYYSRFDKSRLHIALYDDITADPAGAYAGIFRAIGVDEHQVKLRDEVHNVGAVPSTRVDHVAYKLRAGVRPLTRRLPLAGLRRRASVLLDERLTRPTLDPATRAELVEHFRPDIERLQALIGRDLSMWLRATE
jgi:hypothetical protein